MEQLSAEGIRNVVRERYGKRATGENCGCGGTLSTACCNQKEISSDQQSVELGYSLDDVDKVPEGANMGLGCGNPQAIANLKEGENVLDLGSGGGFDCFLASSKVGPTGKVIGVDMTPEMLKTARANVLKGSYDNVEFRLGEIENIPVADNSIDVIMSNCVINLSPEKTKVFSEAFRALKPGGRLAISDILALQELPEEYQRDIELLGACIGGAETIENTINILNSIGFEKVEIQIKKGSRQFFEDYFPGSNVASYVTAAAIQASKPLQANQL